MWQFYPLGLILGPLVRLKTSKELRIKLNFQQWLNNFYSILRTASEKPSQNQAEIQGLSVPYAHTENNYRESAGVISELHRNKIQLSAV